MDGLRGFWIASFSERHARMISSAVLDAYERPPVAGFSLGNKTPAAAPAFRNPAFSLLTAPSRALFSAAW
jgi:hypothetical protein